MNNRNILISFEKILKYSLMGILILYAMAFLFIFIINWEDWFFGVKIEGLPAGVYLAVKCLAAITILVAILMLPKYIRIMSILTLAYFGFLFADSAFTIRRLTSVSQILYNIQILFILIPIALLIIHFLANRPEKISS